jgi:hypothetical protein
MIISLKKNYTKIVNVFFFFFREKLFIGSKREVSVKVVV